MREKELKKRKQFIYAVFETACLCERENSEESFAGQFCLHVHL